MQISFRLARLQHQIVIKDFNINHQHDEEKLGTEKTKRV